MKDKDQIQQEQQPAADAPKAAQGRPVEGEGMSSSYSGMGNLTKEDGERMDGAETDAPETTAP